MRRTGFTLIELMVAMGLFITVITVIVSLFLQSSRAERVVAKRAAAIDNVALAIEQIAREIRTGTDFPVVTEAGGRGFPEFNFTNYLGQKVVYRGTNGAIEKSTDNGLSFLRLTSENVKITRFGFWVLEKSADGTKNFTPRITVVAQAQGPFESPFNLQTTVEGRLIFSRL